jgi:FAD synthetase
MVRIRPAFFFIHFFFLSAKCLHTVTSSSVSVLITSFLYSPSAMASSSSAAPTSPVTTSDSDLPSYATRVGTALSSAELLASIQEDAKTAPHIWQAVCLLRETIDKHGLEKLTFSFNGGKDCTVALHLLRAALVGYTCEPVLSHIKAIYFAQPHEFPELSNFMHYCSKLYCMPIVQLQGDFKQGLTSFLDEESCDSIVMGQRSVDPGMENLTEVSPSDPGWPTFTRVNPMMKWTHQQVWSFLRSYCCEYCSLYELGYTSLGPTTRTIRNPFLKTSNDTFLPAYFLKDGTKERAGRLKKPSITKPAAAPDTAATAAVVEPGPQDENPK